jgi:2-haloacid dehalogenase
MVAAGLGLASGGLLRPRVRGAPPPTRFAAVAFDYLVLFNPDSIEPVIDQVAPGRGREFASLWRTRQFEYCWLRSITGRYVDFSAITEDALVYTADALQIPLSAADRRRLLDAYLHLTPWPDTASALARLRQSGLRVITLSNFSPSMLRANAEHAGLLPFFDALVSTDANHTYKPDARAYALGVDRLAIPKDEIVFAAFAGWDAAGAKSFGYPTVWVNRVHQPAEELGAKPDAVVTDMHGLLEFVLDARAVRPSLRGGGAR